MQGIKFMIHASSGVGFVRLLEKAKAKTARV